MTPVNQLISAQALLRAQNAVAALLVTEDGRYLLQRRDDLATIWYPDHWGLFGGAVEEGEAADAAMRRELLEELEFAPDGLEWFTRFDFDFTGFGQKQLYRVYYLIPLRLNQLDRLCLHEGAELGVFSAAELFGGMKLVPYDAFALWLHHARHRLREGAE
jgi:8-oxo-dGTP pyrophosphatase MutT (NUDIX family)